MIVIRVYFVVTLPLILDDETKKWEEEKKQRESEREK
jgi:hypothetical protein